MNFVQEELLSEGFRTDREEVIEEGVKEYFQRKILPVLLGSSLIAGVAGIGGTVMKHNIMKTKENVQRLIELKGAGNGRYSFTVAGKPAEYSEQTHLLKLNGKMEELGGQPAQNIAEAWIPPEEKLRKLIEKLIGSTEYTVEKLKAKASMKAIKKGGEAVFSSGELEQIEALEREVADLNSVLKKIKSKKKLDRKQLADFKRELKEKKKRIKILQRTLGDSILRGVGIGVLCGLLSAALAFINGGSSGRVLYKGIMGGVSLGTAGFAAEETKRREAIAKRPEIEEEVFSY